jgi:hypothetical protein
VPTLIAPKKLETDLQSKQKSDFFWAMKGTVRIAPSFFVLALIATVITYLIGVPAADRGIAASVPTITLFIVLRILMLVIPEPPKVDPPKRKPTIMLMILAVTISLSALVTVDMIFSSGIFSLLSYPNLAVEALNIALYCALISTFSFVFMLADAMRLMGVDLTQLIVLFAWKVFRYPSRLAEHLYIAQRAVRQ